MRNLTSLAAVILLIAFTATLDAQDAARAEELLKWFPQGQYMNVNHRDDLRLVQGDAYELYQKLFEPQKAEEAKGDGEKEPKGNFSFFSQGAGSITVGRILSKDDLELPPALLEGLYAMTTAAPISLIDEPEGENDRVQTVTLESEDGEEGGGRQMGVFIMRKANMGVYRYHDLDTAIADALEKSQIARVGARLAGRPIYSFSLSKGGHRSGDTFAWASETGELLVAPDRKTLRKMVLAGHGRMARLMDEPAYVDLVTVMPELGAKWSMHVLIDMNLKMANAFEDQGMDPDKLEEMRERQRNNPIMQIESLNLGERLVSRSYRVYEESEAAENSMSEEDGAGIPQMAGVQAWNEYQQLLKQRKQTELRDNIVVTSIAVDEKLMAAEQSANAAMQQQLMQGGGAVTITTKDGKQMKLEMMHSDDGKNVTIKGDEKKKK